MKVNLKVSIHNRSPNEIVFRYNLGGEGPEWTCCLFYVLGSKWGTRFREQKISEGDTKLETALYSCLTC